MTPASATRVSPNFASRVLTRHPCWASTLATESWTIWHASLTAASISPRRSCSAAVVRCRELICRVPAASSSTVSTRTSSHRCHRNVLPYAPASCTAPLIVVAGIRPEHATPTPAQHARRDRHTRRCSAGGSPTSYSPASKAHADFWHPTGFSRPEAKNSGTKRGGYAVSVTRSSIRLRPGVTSGLGPHGERTQLNMRTCQYGPKTSLARYWLIRWTSWQR